jgi:ankyrin repeat protein
VLRHCLPASIRQTLDQLPESLDDTYLRVLGQIPQSNQAHAHHMLQCLVVAVRPLRVEELAEMLAFEFDAAPGGIPKYRAALRLDDQTQAVLSTCSSLVTIVNDRYWPHRQVVQFSHFSVKEFLMSNRLGDFSRFHIHPLSAHTVLTQACLGFLLHLDYNSDTSSVKGLPLAKYAAEHWVEHAQFQGVAPHVKAGIETLFDSDKPHFSVWLGIYDMDYSYGYPKGIPNPLYYAALCGFYDLVKHLATKHPQHVNAICGRQLTPPLLAALREDHIEVAELLLEHGATLDVRETTGKPILLLFLSQLQPQRNHVNAVNFLLKHGADVNARDDTLRSPLHLAVYEGKLEVAQALVNHNADLNSQDKSGKTPLHVLSEHLYDGGTIILSHTRLLLENGAEVDRRDKDNQTPLHLAAATWQPSPKLMRLLLEHGANANAENNNGKTPLHLVSESRIRDEDNALNIIRLLLEHGAAVNSRGKNNETPLLLAMGRNWNWLKIVRVLLEHGADAKAENNNGKTPLHLVLSESRIRDEDNALNIIRLLLEHGAAVNSRDKNNETPLLLAMGRNWLKLVRILLEHGEDANAENNNGKTPLHLLSESQIHDEGDALNLIWPLIEHGAVVNRRDKNNQTPLLLAIRRNWWKLVRILLEHGADTTAENSDYETPLLLETGMGTYIVCNLIELTLTQMVR